MKTVGVGKQSWGRREQAGVSTAARSLLRLSAAERQMWLGLRE